MKPNIDYTLYLITNQKSINIEYAIKKAIKGGVTLVQLREKNISSLHFYKLANNVRKITTKFKIPLIINDRIDIALSVNADGIHIGQNDIPANVARKIIGHNKILGVSVSNLKEALIAVDNGADYLGVGSMYPTNTKIDADIISVNELIAIRKSVNIPIVIIGGINKHNILNFKDININGLAVSSAIINQINISKAAKDLKKAFLKNF